MLLGDRLGAMGDTEVVEVHLTLRAPRFPSQGPGVDWPYWHAAELLRNMAKAMEKRASDCHDLGLAYHDGVSRVNARLEILG